MSKAFEVFIAQYRSTGRSHGDGYSAAMFSGMSTSERETALSMLVDAALAGDSAAVDALRYFDMDSALSVLKKVVDLRPSMLAALVAAAMVYERTDEEIWVSRLVDLADAGAAILAWPAIQSIPNKKMQDYSVRTKIATYIGRYLMRDDEALVLRRIAAKKLLAVFGLVAIDGVFQEFVVRLTSD